MRIALHKRARTTPAVRAEIAQSEDPVWVLAHQYNVTEATIRKWKSRAEFNDRPHTAPCLQTTLTPTQEAIAVYRHKALVLPLDDLLALTRELLTPAVSRSGLDRFLRRNGVGWRRDLLPPAAKTPSRAFKAYAPGFLHLDVKYLPQIQDETSRRYLFVAPSVKLRACIDRATRWVILAITPNNTAASARAFLNILHKACPIKIPKLLTDNGKEFTAPLFGSRSQAPSGEHEFDQLCQALGIEHRLTPPRRPQTNGMVERFNGRIADILKTHHFDSALDLEQTLHRYVTLPNSHLPKSSLGSQPPIQSMKAWYITRPDFFHRPIYNRPGLDIS